MGQGGFITLVNATNSNWNSTAQHSYQMNSWNFPETISSGQAATVYVEWDEGIFTTVSDDAAEANFTLEGTDSTFQIQARAGNGFNLNVSFLNLQTLGNPVGTILSLGWQHNGYVNFILAGESGNYVSTNLPSASWMQDNLNLLGAHTLSEICMPGSHDTGMSVFSSGTAFAFDCNTLTQSNNVLNQLQLGTRYFDIRPVISSGQYYTGHYGLIDQISSYQGANGQSISSIVSNLNDFIAANNELVILNLSHDLNTDVGNDSYRPFNGDEWDGLFKLLSGTNNLYISNDANIDFMKSTLNSLIGEKGAVIIIVETQTDLGSYAGNGFYPYSSLNAYNSYSDSNDLDTMSGDQLQKMKEETGEQYFLLSWTLTQDNTEATTCQFGTASSIMDLANAANQSLPRLVFPAIASDSFPNILYTDNITDSMQASMAMAINCKLLDA